MCALYRALAAFLTAVSLAGSAPAACPPDGQTKAGLQALKAAQWRLPVAEADAARQSLALDLLGCLADPDPVLRDELAFEALSSWMRGKALTVPTLQAIRTRLAAILDGPADEAGFCQPFAALALAEVARVDRLQPFLSAQERAALVASAAAYLAAVRDYRGHDAQLGWRHGVAHGADLVLQLSLNPALQREQAETRRHNLSLFLSVLYVAVQENSDAESKARLLPGLRAALTELG